MPSLPGCAKAAAPPPTHFVVAGTQREAIVVLPSPYQRDRSYPLIVAFHGRTNTNAQARDYFGLEATASPPAIFVYPAGLRDASGQFTWSDPGDQPGALRNFASDTIVSDLAEGDCVDLDAVFVVIRWARASPTASPVRAAADRCAPSAPWPAASTARPAPAGSPLCCCTTPPIMPSIGEELRRATRSSAMPSQCRRRRANSAPSPARSTRSPRAGSVVSLSRQLHTDRALLLTRWPAGAGPVIIRFFHGLAG